MRAVAACTNVGAVPDRALDMTVLLVLVRRDRREVWVVTSIPRVHGRVADRSAFRAAKWSENVGFRRSSEGAVVRVERAKRAVGVRRRSVMLLRRHGVIVLHRLLMVLRLLLLLLDVVLLLLLRLLLWLLLLGVGRWVAAPVRYV